MNLCTKCGNSLSETARFCSKCGSVVSEKAESDTNILGSRVNNKIQSPINYKNTNGDSISFNKPLIHNNRFFNKIIKVLPALLILINTIIVFYVIYHPGLFYHYRSDITAVYPHVNDTWPFIGIIFLFNLFFLIIFIKRKLFISAISLSSIFILILYFYPKLLFHFTDTGWGHSIPTIPLLVIIVIILIDLIAFFQNIKTTDK